MINEKLLKNEEKVVYELRSLYSSFGYSQYKMSKFEEYDLYVRNKDFLISDRIITFTDTNGKLLALKPDVTLSIINNYSKSSGAIQKMYYNENVYRVSGVNGRFREIMQTGLECIGEIGSYEIAEVLYLAIKSLGVIDECFSLEVSHAQLLYSLLADAGIEKNVLSEVLACINNKSSGENENLLKENKITAGQAELISALNDSYSDINSLKKTMNAFSLSENTEEYLNEFTKILNSVLSEENKGKITVNFSLSSDAGYYSGIVFKGYINSIPVCVLSGGQYDKLMKKFGENAGAVGFAVYLDSLERFKSKASQYDTDVILLCDKASDLSSVIKAVEEIIAGGERVLVQNSVPDNISYKRIIKWEGR